MTTTLSMIRRIRDIMNERNGVQTGYPTLFDIRLSILLMYLRSRYFRHGGIVSPI